MKYNLFYDESEHSRKITHQTIKAENFALNFVAAIIGYDEFNLSRIENEYLVIEEKYNTIFSVSELKSTIISKNKYKNGLSSFKSIDIDLIEDIIDFCSRNNLKIYLTIQNKIHFLIVQLLKNYSNNPFFDADALGYSVTKLICMYRPENVIDAIYNEDVSFVYELKKFCIELLAKNKNIHFKQKENEALQQILILLEDIDSNIIFDWQYGISFYGFQKYLKEQTITDYELFIDEEGNGNTYQAAKKEKITSSEVDSKNSVGIRIADFVAGFVSRFIIAIGNDISYKSIEDNKNRKLLNEKWFNIDERRFKLYKKIKKVVVDQNNSWNKAFCSLYSDEFLYFISLLNYISGYDKYDEFTGCKKHQEYLNGCANIDLTKHFETMSNKLEIEIEQPNKDHYYNQRGAIIFKDHNKHKYLTIDKNERIYYVLSVGFLGRLEKACVTIQEENEAILYLLPDSLFDWVMQYVSLANLGVKIFPAYVKFIKNNEEYEVEIL